MGSFVTFRNFSKGNKQKQANMKAMDRWSLQTVIPVLHQRRVPFVSWVHFFIGDCMLNKLVQRKPCREWLRLRA